MSDRARCETSVGDTDAAVLARRVESSAKRDRHHDKRGGAGDRTAPHCRVGIRP
jgi:hypothetical protein